MNREEWVANREKDLSWHYKSHKVIAEWRTNNNIPDNVRVDIHHRDDTIEARRYNYEHYEMWGFNECGIFDRRYAVVLLHTDHARYHFMKNQPMRNPIYREKVSQKLKGRKLTLETKQKLREANLGKTTPQTVRDKQSKALKGIKRSEATRQRMSEVRKKIEITHEWREKLTIGAREYIAKAADVYKKYRSLGGKIK